MNTIKANISSIWKSYSNYFYAILVLPWEYTYIKFPINIPVISNSRKYFFLQNTFIYQTCILYFDVVN